MSGNNFIPFALPEIGEDEINEVTDTLRNGWVTTGPKTKTFENDFSSYLGESFESIAVNSATSGLHLALEAVGVKENDEVIVPSLTFTATAEVVRYLGAHPVFVDCDWETMNIDADKIANAITTKTKAIIPVHYAGLPCQMDKILDLAKAHDLKVIEDAAHAFPSLHNNKLIGTLDSDATVFSFYANKTMTTGEGGMVVTKNPELAKRIKIMRLHGIDRDAFDRFTSEKPKWYYEVIAPGFKYNMSDISASLGIHQLRKINRFVERRQALANRYFKELEGLPLTLPEAGKNGCKHSWHLFVIRLTENAKVSRDELINALSNENIGTSVHYVPLHRQPYWQLNYNLRPEDFPQTEKSYQSMVSIPLYTRLTDEQQQRVIESITRILC